ncbi:hypothetical protein C8R45DRAFT_1069137 [Mycena sanguinolenta]|nr:hypothetical protein C8R45DRAFT_1069137 [Mycena sanguinolenta]
MPGREAVLVLAALAQVGFFTGSLSLLISACSWAPHSPIGVAAYAYGRTNARLVLASAHAHHNPPLRPDPRYHPCARRDAKGQDGSLCAALALLCYHTVTLHRRGPHLSNLEFFNWMFCEMPHPITRGRVGRRSMGQMEGVAGVDTAKGGELSRMRTTRARAGTPGCTVWHSCLRIPSYHPVLGWADPPPGRDGDTTPGQNRTGIREREHMHRPFIHSFPFSTSWLSGLRTFDWESESMQSVPKAFSSRILRMGQTTTFAYAPTLNSSANSQEVLLGTSSKEASG